MTARWPWLTRRRGVCLGGLVVAAAIGIPWLHRANARGFLGEVDGALPMSVALSAETLGDWVAVRRAQSRTVATIAARVPSERAADAVRSTVLPVVVADGGYAGGNVEPAGPADTSRRVLLETVPLTDSPGATSSSTLSRPPASPPPASPAGTAPHADGPIALAVFRAPIVRDGRIEGVVRLQVALTESNVSHFNIAARDDRTQRTLLLLRGADGEALPLLTVSEPGGAPRLPRSSSVPRGFTRRTAAGASYATAAAIAQHPHGIGTGITGARVVYATAAVAGTPWLLVREREVDELLALVRPSLFVNDAVLTLLTTLLLIVLMLRWRAQHQRAETAAIQLRATFVASVSHELRTPLTQVRMYAEMLRLGLLPSPDERARALGVIEKETERLTLLIERALAFVRTGQPAPPLPADAVVVAHAVTRALEAISALADERFVQLRYEVDAALTVRMARDDLQQVLLNLLDNAIKYGPVGQRIDVSAVRAGEVVRLTVRDRGPGVSPAERETIWQPFRRGGAAVGGAVGGSGIGLVVVRDLVERAGGRAYVERPGTGTGTGDGDGACFVVELPPDR